MGFHFQLSDSAMKRKLITRHVSSQNEIKKFFNESAQNYREQHGHANRLLNYRIQQVLDTVQIGQNDKVLDIGCGNGHHLFALADRLGMGIGVDFSEKMIQIAREKLAQTNLRDKLHFQVDNSQKLTSIQDSSMDVVICIGAFEHMMDKKQAAQQMFRVLKANGRMVILTPNGGYFWYKRLAPALGLETKHLSSDAFMDPEKLTGLFRAAKFSPVKISYWTFIPRGDMNRTLANFLYLLDLLGRFLKIPFFRGGIIVSGIKPGVQA